MLNMSEMCTDTRTVIIFTIICSDLILIVSSFHVDHGSQHGGFYDDGYNTEQDHFKGSSGAGGKSCKVTTLHKTLITANCCS